MIIKGEWRKNGTKITYTKSGEEVTTTAELRRYHIIANVKKQARMPTPAITEKALRNPFGTSTSSTSVKNNKNGYTGTKAFTMKSCRNISFQQLNMKVNIDL